MQILSVREMTSNDVGHIVDYWHSSSAGYLHTLGADIAKIPDKNRMLDYLSSQVDLKYKDKQSYALIWLADGQPIGHCNTNPIVFGKEAYMHLHLWNPEKRKKGCGQELLRQTLPYFFENLNVQTLYCEPYAVNEAPNRTLQKLGFDFVMKHITTPGSINFEQEVNRWRMTTERYREMMAQ